jgi:hypothetical protein
MKKHAIGVEHYSISDANASRLSQEIQQLRMEQRLSTHNAKFVRMECFSEGLEVRPERVD